MNRFATVMLTAACFLLCIALFNNPEVAAQDKQLLSEAIRKVIETQGVEAAKKQFAKLYSTQKDLYNIDMQGIAALSKGYAQNGNIEAAGAVMEIAAPFMQDMMTGAMNAQSNGMAQKLAEAQRAEKAKQAKSREEKQLLQQNKEANEQGKARDDLERFTGLYGDPAETNKNRRLWVMVSCDGYLVSGAIWGDVSPWWMRSAADKVFTYSDSFSNFKIEFKTDTNGKARRMIHDLNFMKSPLERLGPIPDDWGSCLERPKR